MAMDVVMNKRTAALIGCLAMDPANDLGAALVVVNGTAVTEGNAVAYVRKFREMMGLEDDVAWVVWQARSGLTDEAIAADTMDYLMGFVAQRQAAEELGISIPPDELEEEVGVAIRSLGEDGFAQAVKRLGVTEAQYREGLRDCMLHDALFEKVTRETKPASIGEIRNAVAEYRKGRGRKDQRPLSEISREVSAQVNLEKKKRRFEKWLAARLTRNTVQFYREGNGGAEEDAGRENRPSPIPRAWRR